jgi:hypothetical protein
MQSLAVSARIWGKTIFLNACFFGLGGIFTGDIFRVLGAGLLLIGGFVCTLPLLLLMVPLVNISALLPYKLAARIAWLAFYLIIIVILFCLFFSLVEKGAAFVSNSYANQLMTTGISGVLVAVLTTRKSLKKFYTTP